MNMALGKLRESESHTRARVVEFYAGIGGLHRALAQSSVSGSVIRAFDWDQSACQVYQANHGSKIIERTDISTLSVQDLAVLGADLWLMSPSCQPYTVLNPLAKGAEDPRAKSFLHVIHNVLPELVAIGKQPKFLLVENVAGFETSTTRQHLLSTMKMLGYNCAEFLLTPLQFGIPNSRLRYYLLAKVQPLKFYGLEHTVEKVWRHIPGMGDDWVDPRSNSGGTEIVNVDVDEIRQFLDEEEASPSQFAIPVRVLEKWGRLFDIVHPSTCRSCCFTRGYTKMAERAGSVLQNNEALDTTTIFDRFLAAQAGGDPDAVRILEPLGLRYFSPSELLRLFCFQKKSDEHLSSFIWPESISNKTKYRLIGNSVNVQVVTHLIDYLFK